MAAPAVELSDELAAALEGDIPTWRGALDERPGADPFRALRNNRALEEEILAATGFRDIPAFLKGAAGWRDELEQTVVLDEPDPRVEVLRVAWQRLSDQIALGLRRAREAAPALPAEGGVLAFVDGLDLCVVTSYRFVHAVPHLTVVEAIEDPRSAFDVVDDLIRRPHPTRTELKRMLQSSHRLVWHRDVMGHVDRREEQRVFGPSIDTLHLAELLARRYLNGDTDRSPERILEVGTGSGFLSAGLLRHLPTLQRLLAIEPEVQAATCTRRNLEINAQSHKPADSAAAILLSRFDPELIAGDFDLVVCNPPYIPDPPEGPGDRSRQRTGAVAGVQLLDDLLAAAPRLLAPGGELLLIVSSVTPPAFVHERVPDGFELSELGPGGTEVLFEVEEVFSREGYLNFLLANEGLWEKDHSYHHTLHPMWLRREA